MPDTLHIDFRYQYGCMQVESILLSTILIDLEFHLVILSPQARLQDLQVEDFGSRIDFMSHIQIIKSSGKYQ